MLTPLPLAAAVSEWLDGYYSGSPRTQKAYRDAVEGRMLPFLVAQKVTWCHEATSGHLTAFMRHEAERPRTNQRRDGDRGDRLSTATLDGIFGYLRTFWNWCEAMDYVPRSPMRKVRKPVTSKLIREGFTREEVQRLLQWVGYKDTPVIVARDRAILLILLSSGCRASEVAMLQWRQIDWANRRFKVLGKGDKERYARLGAKAYPALRAWKEARRQWIPGEPKPTDPVWITLRRTPMGYTTLWKMIRNLADYAGVENATPHRFRHTAATELYLESANGKLVQHFLGHSKMATTDRYLKRIGAEMEKMDYRTPDEIVG